MLLSVASTRLMLWMWNLGPPFENVAYPFPLWKQCMSNIYMIYHKSLEKKKHFVVGHLRATRMWGFAQAFVDLDCKANLSHTHTFERSISTSPMSWPIVQSKLAYKLEVRFPWMDSYHKAISSPFTATLVTLSKLDKWCTHTTSGFGCKGFCFQLVGPRLHNSHWVKNNEPI